VFNGKSALLSDSCLNEWARESVEQALASAQVVEKTITWINDHGKLNVCHHRTLNISLR